MSNYLWRSRHGTYYFRVRVAQHYQAYFAHKSELRASLQTSDRRVAKRKAHEMIFRFELFLEQIDCMAKKVKGPQFGWTLALSTKEHASGVVERSHTLEMSTAEHAELGDASVAAIIAGITASVSAGRVMPAPTPALPVIDGSTILAVFEEFLGGNTWSSPKTAIQYKGTINLFVRCIGDKPVGSVTKSDARDFLQKVQKLPPNINAATSKYRGMSVAEILASNPEKTLSVKSVSDQLTRMKAFFNWIPGNVGGCEANPFDKLRPPRSKKVKTRDAFSLADVQTIFGCYIYAGSEWPRKKQGKEPSKFWIPLLLAYTGCRLNEACQLYLADVYQEAGIWVFDFNESREDQSLKGEFPRKVPIHKKLIEAGFLGYLDQVKASGTARLFPELEYSTTGDGYGKALGEFWRGLLKELGVVGTPHSFRHNVIQGLSQADVGLTKIQALVGQIDREGRSVAVANYGAGNFTSVQKEKAINSLDYGLSLEPGISYQVFRARTSRR